MLPLRDENPHPPGFKPKVTYALIIINVIVFFIEVAATGQILEFRIINENAFSLFYNWGAVPNCITGGTQSVFQTEAGPVTIQCPAEPYISLLSSIFLHGGIMHLGGNMLFCGFLGITLRKSLGK